MTLDEFTSKVLEVFPDALLSVDPTGELQISTGMMFSNDGSDSIVPLPPENLDTP